MNELIVFIAICLATYRATRLVVSDELLTSPRMWLARRIAHRARLVYLMSCEWCMSVWLGGVIVLVTDAVTSVPVPALTWASASAIAGFLSGYEAEPDE